MSLDGLITYFSIPLRPRAAFAHLQNAPMWGWAACAGIFLTVVALLFSAPAQLHVLAVTEAQKIAALPPSEQFRERVAVAHLAPSAKLFLMIGALAGPWVVWFLIAIIFFVVAAVCGRRATFGMAWVAALNSYVVYAIAGVVNSILVALRDPNTANSALDLVRVPSPGWFAADNPWLGGFLSAYNPLNIWYYAVVAVALERLLRVPRPAAIIAAIGYSVLYGIFAAAASQPGP